MSQIYKALANMVIADYPSAYRPAPGAVMGISHEYCLRLRTRTGEKEVYWIDDSSPSAPDAVVFRSLLGKIRTMIEAKPEYQLLPRTRHHFTTSLRVHPS